MIYVDYRDGSKDFIEPLRRRGIDVEETELEFGDFCFVGRGEKGRSVSVGVEFKKLQEAVQALRTNRLQGFQAPGCRMYDFAYLMVEGHLLYDNTGLLKVHNRRRFTSETYKPMPGHMTIGELMKRVNVLHLCAGMNPIWTHDRNDSMQQLLALYHTWTDTDLDKHKSHIAIYTPGTLLPISDMRRTLSTFPGIGRHLSLAVEQHFGGSLLRAVQAPVAEWAQIQSVDDKGRTRRLGMSLAQRIVDFLKGA